MTTNLILSKFRSICQALLQISWKTNQMYNSDGNVPRSILVDEVDMMTSPNMRSRRSRKLKNTTNSNYQKSSVSSPVYSKEIFSSTRFSLASSPSTKKKLSTSRSVTRPRTKYHIKRGLHCKETRSSSAPSLLGDVEDIVEFTISIQKIEDIVLNRNRNSNNFMPIVGVITLSSRKVINRTNREIEFNVCSSPLSKSTSSLLLGGTSERYYGFFGVDDKYQLEQIKLALPMKKRSIFSNGYIERQLDLTLSLVSKGNEIQKVGVAVIKLSGKEFGKSTIIPIVRDTNRLACKDQEGRRHSLMSANHRQSQDGNLIDFASNPKLRLSITARRHQENKEKISDSATSAYLNKFFPSTHHQTSADTIHHFVDTRTSSEDMSQRTASFTCSLADSLLFASASYDEDISLLFSSTFEDADDESCSDEDHEV